nr:hypothetical protein [Pandoravirus belohorizontensis]
MQRAIDEKHRGYSDCMHTIIKFHKLHEGGSAAYFSSEMQKAVPSLEVDDVARCVGVTKDYFRDVRSLAVEYSISDAGRRAELSGRHFRFVKYVKPLDKLEDSSVDEDVVFKPLFP